MTNKRFYIYMILSIMLGLQACAAVVVTGGAAGAAMVHDRRTPGTFIEDETIELKAIQAFFTDKEIHEQAHLNATSFNTVVLLTGEAPTEELRQRIVEKVRNIPKVTHVYNEITIAAPSSLMSRSSDTVITTKVKTKLLHDKRTPGTRIKIVTENGVVYLIGLLSRAEADSATEIARHTRGVQKVVKLFQYID
ncbi:MAG: BON domain-containing protein [Gammaproteobacteria bacterium]|nr:BON domain-containing protein [Gammaproteobacteria bacterium]